MEDLFDSNIAPLLLGAEGGLVLVHILGIYTVPPLLLVASVPAMTVGVYCTARYYLRKWGWIS